MTESIMSVGIDIGTSTTQLVFSKIFIENTAAAWTVPTIKIVGKEIVYKSKVYLTPLINETTIDREAVKEIIKNEYKLAGKNESNIDTGAVIITGETARKENAKEVLNMLSGLAGDFVVATAGPELEGIIAGKGSGASKYSREHGCSVINYDIGGGTTNIAIFKNGDIVDTTCLDIGGRLIKIDNNNKISYISKKIRRLIEEKNLKIDIGKIIDREQILIVVDIMSDVIFQIINKTAKTKDLELLTTDHLMSKNSEIDYVCFSGGVADCIINESEDEFEFDDIGVFLGAAIRKKSKQYGIKILRAQETIRATVVGAGTHTTDISGSTVSFDEKLLPIKNIPIIRLSEEEEKQVGKQRIKSIANKISWFQMDMESDVVALSIRGSKTAGFDDIQILANDLVKGMRELIDKELPIIVLVDIDNAKALGRSIRERLETGYPVICLDCVSVDNGDYIDVGYPIAGGKVVPVIIKTLLFGY